MRVVNLKTVSLLAVATTILLLLAVALGQTATASPANAAASYWKSCGNVDADYPNEEGGSGDDVSAHRLRCSKARKIAKKCIRQEHVRGWKARYVKPAGEPGYGLMRKGKSRIKLEPTAGGGPRCINFTN